MKNLRMYINGKFCESRSGKWIDVLNPSTEEVISRQPEGTIEDVNEALDAAKAAQKSWAKVPIIERAAYLRKLADGIRARREEFIDIIMREQGKTLTWATVEVDVTAEYFDYMASFARHIEGEIIPSDRPNETILLTKKPIGVVAGILPWNFPFFLIARKAGAALIAGCTIVIKPSQLTPENCTTFAEVVDQSGLPAGVINIVTGKGSVIGNEMAGPVPFQPVRALWPPLRKTLRKCRLSWVEKPLRLCARMPTWRRLRNGLWTAASVIMVRYATTRSVSMFKRR